MKLFKSLFGGSSKAKGLPRQSDWPIDKGYRDAEEQRVFGDIPKLKEVRTCYEKDPQTALDMCRQLCSEAPDLDLGYFWAGICLKALGRQVEANEFLADGVKRSKRKSVLLCKLGEMAFDNADTMNMFMWFSNAILAQAHGPQGHTEYLYMAEIAVGCLDGEIEQRAAAAARRIQSGIMLKPETRNQIRRLANDHRHDIEPDLRRLADVALPVLSN